MRKTLVYCSKNEDDWKKAVSLLKEAGVRMKSWHTEEPGLAGCGAKVDIRTFGRKEPIPKVIYKIEVADEESARAAEVLKDKVQPVRHYGVG